MSAATLNITIEQGATFTRTFTVEENAAPKDITGYTVRGQVRKKKQDAVPTLTFVTNISDPTNGVFDISLTATITAAISGLKEVPVDYLWDLEYESPGGVVTRLVEGTASLVPEVTK